MLAGGGQGTGLANAVAAKQNNATKLIIIALIMHTPLATEELLLFILTLPIDI
jgi:hypothetical protein